MDDDPGSDDALLRAIADLRETFRRLIDEQEALVGAIEDDDADPVRPSPPGPIEVPDVATPASGAEDDPRRRLDALARHFDRKLRQSGAPTTDPPRRPS